MTDDRQLLRRYTTEGSEQAFGELVVRYINLVYSAAVRQMGDAHLAEDVVQTVFTALARKARALPEEVLLGGWLYRHTGFVAAQAARTERRRQARERQALAMNGLDDHTEPEWEHLAPVLDEAMKRLGGQERDAIVLRYFEQRDLHSVGAALGVSEEAARKRLTRALEKLKTFFTRRGLTLTTTTLAAMMTGNGVVAAPAGLAVSVTSAALTGAATTTGITLTLLKVMTMTKLKIGLASAIVVAGVAAPLALQQQSQVRLREENSSLRLQLGRIEQENQRLSNLNVQAKGGQPLSEDQFLELMRLRGEVGLLRNQKNELERLRGENLRLRTPRVNAPAGQTGPAAELTGEVLPLVQFEDAPLTDVIMTLARQANLVLSGMDPRAVVDPTTGKRVDVTIRLENVTAEKALETILSTNNFRLVRFEQNPKTKETSVGIKYQPAQSAE